MARLEHVEESEAGPICRHCGGLVGEDGYAEAMAELTGGDTLRDGGDAHPEDAQSANTETMREQAFSNSVMRGRR